MTTRSRAVLLLAVSACGDLSAKGKPPNAAPAAEYTGHLASGSGTMFLIHIDSFTPDEAANAVALAGRNGDSNAIRAALGRFDAGFIKLGTNGFRVAFARRQPLDDGALIVRDLQERQHGSTSR
jgi:hypothetical protein